METGKMGISVRTFDVQPLLNEVQQMMRELANQRQVDLSFEIQPELETLNADPARFKQILINLLSNAIKFNHEKGFARFRLYRSEDRKWMIGEIEDNGIGIAKDKQKDLFKKFYQENASIARTHEGTGLGLALTKELVELHGGEIRVLSEEGIGSTFTFRLPA